MYHDDKDKAYLKAYFEECIKKGHKLFEWGGMTYCNVCGGATNIISKRDLQLSKSNNPTSSK